jgi:two-component system sensor histidine kinase KdpD
MIDVKSRIAPPSLQALAGRYLAALAVVGVLTLALWPLRERLTNANISLLYMLATLITAVWLGAGPSVLTAILSFFSFNFFLVRPYYTLAVEDPRELIDLVVFLAAALIAGRLAAYARQQAEAAGLNARQQEILYSLTSALNPLTDPAAIRGELRRVAVEQLGATQADYLPSRAVAPVHEGNAVFVLLQAGDVIYGTLRAVFPQSLPSSQYRLLTACAGQAALALQRVDLTAQAQRSQALAEADQLKTALLHAVSHDLRTPITIIKSSAANLDALDNKLSHAERRELARTVEAQADLLDRLVGNLLDMSRLQAGAMVLHRELNALEEVAGDVAAEAFRRHGAERIALDFPDDLPLAPFDYGLMRQALSNIVDNALRYEPEGRRVIIRGGVSDSDVRLEVINHGPTISPEEKTRITEPFYQSRDGRSVVGGVGLGLAIARGIVEVHRGTMVVEDTPGGGATFTITLPQEGA